MRENAQMTKHKIAVVEIPINMAPVTSEAGAPPPAFNRSISSLAAFASFVAASNSLRAIFASALAAWAAISASLLSFIAADNSARSRATLASASLPAFMAAAWAASSASLLSFMAVDNSACSRATLASASLPAFMAAASAASSASLLSFIAVDNSACSRATLASASLPALWLLPVRPSVKAPDRHFEVRSAVELLQVPAAMPMHQQRQTEVCRDLSDRSYQPRQIRHRR